MQVSMLYFYVCGWQDVLWSGQNVEKQNTNSYAYLKGIDKRRRLQVIQDLTDEGEGRKSEETK